MDNSGTRQKTDQWDLIAQWGSGVALNGYEIVEGSSHPNQSERFVVPRSGRFRAERFHKELYLAFYYLETKEAAILEFANRNGNLHSLGEHFHRAASQHVAAVGQKLSRWRSEIRRFQDVFDFWSYVSDGGDLRDFMKKVNANAPLPVLLPRDAKQSKDQPRILARKAVVNTVNYYLRPRPYSVECSMPGCDWKHQDSSGESIVMLEESGSDHPRLRVISSDLLATVWLQFAAFLIGDRKIKRCEAEDCRRLMDVTDFSRPGAVRMHRKCEERMRKQRYRDKNRSSRTELSVN